MFENIKIASLDFLQCQKIRLLGIFSSIKCIKINLRQLIFRGGSNFLKARQEAKKGELDEQLREYIDEWRKQRSKEEEELKRLKEKQAKRKEIRAEQEKKLAQQKKEEEERMRKEEADKKAKEAEEKRKRLEEAEKKRQAMMNAQKEKQNNTGKNCVPRSNLTTSFCPLIQAFMIFRFTFRWRKSPKPW